MPESAWRLESISIGGASGLAVGIALLAVLLLFVATAWADEPVELDQGLRPLLHRRGDIGPALVHALYRRQKVGHHRVRRPLFHHAQSAVLLFRPRRARRRRAVRQHRHRRCSSPFCALPHFMWSSAARSVFWQGSSARTIRTIWRGCRGFGQTRACSATKPMLSVLPKRLYVTLMDGLVFFAAIPAFAGRSSICRKSGVVPVSSAALLNLFNPHCHPAPSPL